jgi:hypothetical protein
MKTVGSCFVPESRGAIAALVVLAGIGQQAARAQDAGAPAAVDDSTGAQIVDGVASSFALPLDDLTVRRHDSEARELLSGLTVTPGLYMPLSRAGVGGRTIGEQSSGSPALRLNLTYQPVGYWFARVTLHGSLDKSRRAPWDPDFTYSFGYDDWHPYTFSLVYSNYSNNRFSPKSGAPVSRLSEGTVSLGWKAPMPRALARPLLIDQSLQIDCRAGLNASPRFERDDGTMGRWKRSAQLGCRYPFTRRLYLDFTAFAYDHGQQPWDPDFTYGFGLFDYRSNRVSIQYSNYSGNRFPWRKSKAGTGRFKDGGLLVSWSKGF